MLIDGGYRNNIPYNIFRTKGDEPKRDELKGVIAIKLDNKFPPDLLEKVYKAIKEYVELSDYIDNSNLPEDDPLLNALLTQLNKKYELVYAKVEVIFTNYLMEDIAKFTAPKEIEHLKDIHRQIKKNNKAIKKLTNTAIKDYQKNHLSPPWTEAKSMLATASEGYAYGSEKGQVQDITDHNHIIPLYDYGVGTFDFDMSIVQPQIRLAQAMAQHKVYNFFE